MGFLRFRKVRHFCQICGAGFSEKQVESGAAVRREGWIHCRKCFRKEFPDECENHPGTKLTVLCAACKRMCCENCVIEIEGKPVCWRCKDRVLESLTEEGRWPETAEPSETGESDADEERSYEPVSPTSILFLGILGFLLCGIPGIAAVIGYMMHIREVARGVAERSLYADIGFIIGVLSVLFNVMILIALLLR